MLDSAMLSEMSNTNILLRRYVYGPGNDEPILWYEGSGTSDKRYLHADERGSIIALSNASGTVTQVNAYDEFGIPQGKAPSGTPGNTATPSFGRFGYTGQAWLPEIGLYHYKARAYSPTLGRFLQSDPIGYGDGMNFYNYVGGDPVNKSDPSGLAEVCVGDSRALSCVKDTDRGSSFLGATEDVLDHPGAVVIGEPRCVICEAEAELQAGFARDIQAGLSTPRAQLPSGVGGTGAPGIGGLDNARRQPKVPKKPNPMPNPDRAFCRVTGTILDGATAVGGAGVAIFAAGAGITPFIPDGEIVGGLLGLGAGVVAAPVATMRFINSFVGNPC